MPDSRLTARVIPVAMIVGLLLGLQLYSPPRIGLWANVFYDSLHVPVFGLIAVSIYILIAGRLAWPRSVLVAFLAACILGLLSEVAQIATSRDASMRDFLANTLGAAGFLALFTAFRTVHGSSHRNGIIRAAAGLIILGIALTPLIRVSAAYLERNLQVPEIVRFDARFGRLLTRVQNADYQLIPASSESPALARMTFGEGPWPGVAYHDLWPDWTDYEVLVICLYVEGDEDLDLSLRVHDLQHRETNAFSDRFTRSFELAPGDHELRIALSDLRNAPRNREMNLEEISELIIFNDGSNSGRSFRIYGIRLE